MRKPFCWLPLLAISAGIASGVAPGTAQSRSLVLDNVRVIGGSGDAPIEGGRIVIQGDRITSIDMWLTCDHAGHMSKMIQIRNVPDAVHRKIKARAAQSGMTLSDYLLAEVERIAALPTRDEMLARLHARTRVKLRTPAAAIIRTERESA